MFTQNIRDPYLEILRRTQWKDIPAVCRVNKNIADVCRSSYGRNIILQKEVDELILRMEQNNIYVYGLNDPNVTTVYDSIFKPLIKDIILEYIEKTPVENQRFTNQNFQIPIRIIETRYSEKVNNEINAAHTYRTQEDEFEYDGDENDFYQWLTDLYLGDDEFNESVTDLHYNLHRDFLFNHPELLPRLWNLVRKRSSK